MHNRSSDGQIQKGGENTRVDILGKSGKFFFKLKHLNGFIIININK